jgi:hypothetical protein
VSGFMELTHSSRCNSSGRSSTGQMDFMISVGRRPDNKISMLICRNVSCYKLVSVLNLGSLRPGLNFCCAVCNQLRIWDCVCVSGSKGIRNLSGSVSKYLGFLLATQLY